MPNEPPIRRNNALVMGLLWFCCAQFHVDLLAGQYADINDTGGPSADYLIAEIISSKKVNITTLPGAIGPPNRGMLSTWSPLEQVFVYGYKVAIGTSMCTWRVWVASASNLCTLIYRLATMTNRISTVCYPNSTSSLASLAIIDIGFARRLLLEGLRSKIFFMGATSSHLKSPEWPISKLISPKFF